MTAAPDSDAQPNTRDKPKRGLRRRLARVGLVLISLFVAAGIGELALRIFGYSPTYFNVGRSFHERHPLIGFRGRPNKEGRWRTAEFDVQIANNELGFRRPKHQNALSQSSRRVLVFGDSFTWGYGVGQGEVFTDRMSVRQPDWHVVNFGQSGIGQAQEFTLFEEYGEKLLEPGDVVIVMLFWNDFGDNLWRQGSDLLRARIQDGSVIRVPPTVKRGPPVTDFLKQNSYLFNLISFWTNRLKAKYGNRPGERSAPLTVQEGLEAPDFLVMKHFLERFRDACEEKGARFLLVAIPGPTELGHPGVDETDVANQRILRGSYEACVKATGVSNLDLLPMFLEAKRKNPDAALYYAIDQHWTPAGHQLAAETITAYLDRMLSR